MGLPKNVKGKLERADEHLDRLVAEVGQIEALKHYGITAKRNVDKSELSLHLLIKSPLPLQRLALIIGDCAHNLRSALDHMIYRAAIRDAGIDPPPDHTKLMFPIVRSPAQFSDYKWRLGKMVNNAAFVALIKSLQPDQRPEVFGLKPLAILEDLDVTDKHRLLNVVTAQLREPHYTIVGDLPKNSPGQIRFTIGALDDGAEVFAVSNAKPIPDVKVEFDIKFEIAIGHTPASTDGRTFDAGEGLIRVLRAEVDYILSELEAYT